MERPVVYLHRESCPYIALSADDIALMQWALRFAGEAHIRTPGMKEARERLAELAQAIFPN